MGGKAKAPPPPDYSGIAAASQASSQYAFQLGQDQLAWAKEQYAKDREVSDAVIARAATALDENQANARADRARYESLYQPLENQLVDDAKSYATDERIQKDMGRSMATVAQTFDAARDSARQQLEGFGVDPSSTRYAALDIGMRAQKAAAQAAAGNQAAQQTEAIGRAMRSEAINVGRGYPGQVVNSYNTAVNAGNQAVNSGIATTASGASSMGTPVQWQGLGNNALGTWSNALTQGYNSQLAQFNANQNASSGWGSALGLIGGIAGRALFVEDGGAIPHDGVPITPGMSPTGGAAVDDVPARLNAGEFVIPEDAVSWYGEKYFQQLIQKARKEKDGAPAKPQTKNAPAADPVVDTTGAIPA